MKNHAKSGDELLTVREVASNFQINPETVRRWVREDKVPAQRLGNMLYFKSEDIQEIMRKGKHGG